MFDFTQYIKLNNTDKRIYMRIRLFIFLSFCIFVLLFIKELIFPSQSFNFNASIDSLANTISKTYVTELGTGFDVASYGDFDTVTISITLDENEAKFPSNTKILSRKSYLAFLSPIDKEKYNDHINNTYEIGTSQYINKNDTLYTLISTNAFDSYIFKNNTILTEDGMPELKQSTPEHTGFAPGTLLGSKTGVFVTDGDTKHAFVDEFAVESLGYNFDNVISATNEELNIHEKARMFDNSSIHPFGTIFFASDSDRTYVYDNNLLHKIQNSSSAQKYAIVTDEESRTTFANCTLERTGFSTKKYHCTIKLDAINKFNGNAYQFIIENMPNVSIAKSNIEFSTQSSEDSFLHRITMLKKELSKFYIN